MLDLILIEFSLLEYFSKSNINTVLIFEKGKFYHFLSAWNKYFKFIIWKVKDVRNFVNYVSAHFKKWKKRDDGL